MLVFSYSLSWKASLENKALVSVSLRHFEWSTEHPYRSLIPGFYPQAMLARSLGFATLGQQKYNPNKNMCFLCCRRTECFPQATSFSSFQQWKEKTLQKCGKSMLSDFSLTENSTFLTFVNKSLWSRTKIICIASFLNKIEVYRLGLLNNWK